MAEETDTPAPSTAISPEPEETDAGITPPTDWLLQRFVRLINSSGDGEMGITLLVGGSLVSGQLISGRAYVRSLAQHFVDRLADHTLAESMGEFVRRVGSVYLEPRGERLPDPMFIHLRDARVFHPSGHPIPTMEGVLWRGQISRIDGFFLGQMGSLSTSRNDAEDRDGRAE